MSDTTTSVSARRRRLSPRAFAVLALAPAFALVAGMLFYPLGYSFWLSLTDSDGIESNFVGLDNYVDLLSDETVREVLVTNALFLISVPLVLVGALVTAVLMYEEVWGHRLFRILFFLPSVLSTVVIGLVFRTFFAYDGPVNDLLEAIGMEPVNWFGEGGTAMAVIILALVWSGFGYGMLLLLAAMADIDPDLYAAARLDGAGWWARTWDITVPSIRRVLVFVSVINVSYVFTSLFGFIFVMTSGGPGYSTTTLDYLIFVRFGDGSLGAGSAVAFLLFLIVLVLTWLQFRVFRDEQERS